MLSSSPPCLFRRVRSILFSPATFRAAAWTSAEATTPWRWHRLSRCSSSCWYSLRFARSRLWLARIRARSLSCAHVRSLPLTGQARGEGRARTSRDGSDNRGGWEAILTDNGGVIFEQTTSGRHSSGIDESLQ